jgi:hypothetical protein
MTVYSRCSSSSIVFAFFLYLSFRHAVYHHISCYLKIITKCTIASSPYEVNEVHVAITVISR